MSEILDAVSILKNAVVNGEIKPTEGLPEDLFFFISSLVPIVNIDLFVTNRNREVLFSWGLDLHHGKG